VQWVGLNLAKLLEPSLFEPREKLEPISRG